MMEPDKEDIPTLYAPLREIRYPVFAVLGNHDIEKPGPPRRKELVDTLKANKVTIMNNETYAFPNGTLLVGIGDNR